MVVASKFARQFGARSSENSLYDNSRELRLMDRKFDARAWDVTGEDEDSFGQSQAVNRYMHLSIGTKLSHSDGTSRYALGWTPFFSCTSWHIWKREPG